MTTSAQRARERTLRGGRKRGAAVRQRSKRPLDVQSIRAALDGERALSWRRQRFVRIDQRTNARGEAEPLQSGGREDDRVVASLVELAQARVHVAAQRFDANTGMPLPQLGLAAQARRADDRSGGQRGDRFMIIGNERVARIFARRDGREDEPLGYVHRDVLQRVDGKIGAPFAKRVLELLDEEALAADRGQRPVEQAIALRRDAQQLDGQVGMERAQP